MQRSGSSRRDRVRAATVQEITETARRILVKEGPEAVTLRAIAREMGMTAPALYRYFGSHHELLRHIIGEIFNSLTDSVQAELHRETSRSMTRKFVVACTEFRRWSLAHKQEYALIFGVPLPGLEMDMTKEDFAQECGRRFALTFLSLMLKLWNESPFPVMADDEIDPGLYDQLSLYRERLGVQHLPIGVVVVFVDCWIRLQGFVSLEVFGHMGFALSDATPMFELMLADMAQRLGLTYP
jgi:AcrR family transcriptional regulator